MARNETPFTEEWLEYHFGLGIDRVYYISTDPDFPRIEAFMDTSRFRSRVELLHYQDFRPGWQARCYNEHLPLITEDWVLVIDVDEFLYLNTFPGISAFLDSIGPGIGQIQFPWLNLMSTDYCESRVLDILNHSARYVSDHVKSMARRKCIDRLGVHSHRLGRLKNCLASGIELEAKPKHPVLFSDLQYFQIYPLVLHFVSRGHLDVLNRIVDHRFFNAKNGHVERSRLSNFLTGAANWSNIPTRYLLMGFLSTLPTANIEVNLPRIGARTELHDLESLFLRNIRKIVDFENDGDTPLASSFETRYRLSQKLSTHDLSGTGKLDDYLKCNTQLEYIKQLRRLMTNADV